MHFRTVAVLCALAWLSACATVENYETSLRTWVGAQEGELIAAWGVPDEVIPLADGSKVVEYLSVTVTTTGGYTTYETMTIERSGKVKAADSSDADRYSETTEIRVPVEVPLKKHYYRCETRFTVTAAGIITSWRHRGNGCQADSEEAANLARFGL